MTKSFTKAQTVLRSTALLTVSSLLLQILGFIYRILLSRMLTAEQMGVYGLLMPVYAVLNAGTLSGFSLAAARTTADFSGGREALLRRASQTVRAAFSMYALFFCLAAILFSLISGGLSKLLGEARLQTAFLLLLPCLLMTALENILKSVFQGLKNVTPSMISECSEQVVRIVSVGFILLMMNAKTGDGARACAGIVCGMIISEIASDVILLLFARGTLPRAPKTHALDGAILRCALPVCAGAACGMLLSSASGAIIPAALQRYGFSARLALSDYGTLSGMLLPLLSFPGAFISPINTVMLPRITESFAAKDHAATRRRAAKTILAGSFAGILFEGAAVVFAPALCGLFFGEKSPAGMEQVFLLGLAALTGFIGAGASCVLNALGRQRQLMLNNIITGIIELPSLYLAISAYGLAGYAAVSAVLGALQTAALLIGVANALRREKKQVPAVRQAVLLHR